MPTKVCSKCGIEKDISEFHKANGTGTRGDCKKCKNTSANLYYNENKGYYAEKHKEYCKENKVQRVKAWASHYKKNKLWIKEYKKKYFKTDKGKFVRQKSHHKRRALKLKVFSEDFSPSEIFERDGYVCQLCHKKTRPDFKYPHPLYPHLDHIRPLSLGGEHSKINSQCLCAHCNQTKNNTGTGDQMRLFG